MILNDAPASFMVNSKPAESMFVQMLNPINSLCLQNKLNGQPHCEITAVW
jgi:hypothetical protein